MRCFFWWKKRSAEWTAGLWWTPDRVMKHRTFSLWLIQKALHSVAYSSRNIRRLLAHTRKRALQLRHEQWLVRDNGPIQWILGEEIRWDRDDIDVHVRACSFVIVFACASVHCFFFPACLSIHLLFCLRICQSHWAPCICAGFGQRLQSVFCARFVSPSSGLQSIALCESLCQPREALLSQTLWNLLNVHRGLMQIKSMTPWSTRRFTGFLNAVAPFIHLIIHLYVIKRANVCVSYLCFFYVFFWKAVIWFSVYILTRHECTYWCKMSRCRDTIRFCF